MRPPYLSTRRFAVGYPLGEPFKHIRPRPMDRDEVLDLTLQPVNAALVLVDQAQLAIVDKDRGVSVSVEPLTKPLHCVGLMFFVALDQQIRGVAPKGSFPPGEDSEFVAFDVNFDKSDVGKVVIVDPSGLDLDLVVARNHRWIEAVGRIDRRATELASAIVAIGETQFREAATVRDGVRLNPAALALEYRAQDSVEHRDRFERDDLGRMSADPISVHADFRSDVDAGTVAIAEQIEQLHFGLVIGAA